METIAYVITGRGARIKHINHDGAVLCPSAAAAPAVNRFEKLPVCTKCQTAYDALPAPVAAPVEDEPAIQIHFSARVTRFMADQLAKTQPVLAAELATPRLERNGRGFTAFVTTTRSRAEALVVELDKLYGELESGERAKGLKGGMNFQPEAVAKGIEHIALGLAGIA